MKKTVLAIALAGLVLALTVAGCKSGNGTDKVNESIILPPTESNVETESKEAVSDGDENIDGEDENVSNATASKTVSKTESATSAKPSGSTSSVTSNATSSATGGSSSKVSQTGSVTISNNNSGWSSWSVK